MGSPFLKNAKTKIDVFVGTLFMEFNGDVVNFNIKDVDIYDKFSVNYLGTNSPLSKECCEFSDGFMQDLFLDRKLDNNEIKLIEKI